MIAAIYARKSTEDERSAEDGKSTARQVDLARAFAVKQGWAVADQWVVTDDGVSGANFTARPGLVRLLDGAAQKPRPFDIVVVMSLDRIGREQVQTSGVIRQLHAAGVQVWCYQDAHRVKFDSPVDKLMVGIGGFAAEEYRHAVRAKTIEALRRKASLGHHVAGQAFGYTLVRKGDHSEREINPDQAEVVKQIFEWSAQGYGNDRILRKLTEAQIPGHWSKNIIRRVLTQDLYRGIATYGRTTQVDDGGHGTRVRVDASQWISASVPDLRIIADELWEQVQARKEKTRLHYLRAADGTMLSKPEAGIVSKVMLSGIARCAECGSTMTLIGRRDRLARYRCLGRHNRGPSFCSNASGVPMDLLNRAVIDCLLTELLSDRDRLWALIEEHDTERRQAREAQQVKQPNATKEIAKLEAEITRLVSALASGKAPASITAGIAERESRIALLKSTPVVAPVSKARFLEGYAGFRIMLNQKHPQQVRQTLRKLGVDRIVVTCTPTGWDFQGDVDLGHLIHNGSHQTWCDMK